MAATSYIVVYKCAYSAALITQVYLLREVGRADGITAIVTGFYVVSMLVIMINLLGIVGLARGAVGLERFLSFGRMLTTIAGATLILGGLVAYSPVFLVIWRPMLRVADRDLVAFWFGCGILLLLEILYYQSVGAVGRRVRTPSASEGEGHVTFWE
jgi:hypothetical protein